MKKSLSPLACVPMMLSACQTLTPVAPVYGPTNPAPAKATPAKTAQAAVQAYASMVELKPEMEEKYRQLHADVWPKVKAAIRKANIHNYSIYVADLDGKRYLFSYFEYTGKDPAADFASIAEDPTTHDKWWPLTDACQIRLPGTPTGEQWKSLERVMHID